MKNTFKKVTSVGVLLILLFSFFKVTNAFDHMDICNYTDWDSSGNYYDWICTESGKPSEQRDINFLQSSNSENTQTEKVEKKHALNEVKHNTGSSSSFIYSNNQRNTEIENLKKQVNKQNILLAKYIKENNELIKKEDILIKEIVKKNTLLDRSEKENNLLKNYIAKKSKLEKETIKYSNTEVNNNTNSTKTAAEIIRERIKKRNELLK